MRVAIVGLGAAGLRTAMLLERAGVEVALFDARDRIGGRLHTVRTERGWYDAGGEWLDSDHSLALALLEELGAPAVRCEDGPRLLWFNGDSTFDDKLWPDAAEASERVRRQATDWADRPPKSDSPLSALLDECAGTERARWYLEAVRRSDEGTDTSQVSLLSWLDFYRHYLSREGDRAEMSAYRLPEGGGGLCDRMALALQAVPNLDRPLRAVQVSEDHVELWFKDEVAAADRVVLAMPPSCLTRIEFEPDRLDAQVEAWQALRMTPTVKVAMEFESKFWGSDAECGSLMAHLPFQQVWDASRGEDAILLAYICGADAERIRVAEDPVSETAAALSRVYPEASARLRGGALHDWIGDEWVGGGFTYLQPGGPVSAFAVSGRAEGRIHFAGEHTAGWVGFIEGALESAERVAREILDAESL